MDLTAEFGTCICGHKKDACEAGPNPQAVDVFSGFGGLPNMPNMNMPSVAPPAAAAPAPAPAAPAPGQDAGNPFDMF